MSTRSYSLSLAGNSKHSNTAQKMKNSQNGSLCKKYRGSHLGPKNINLGQDYNPNPARAYTNYGVDVNPGVERTKNWLKISLDTPPDSIVQRHKSRNIVIQKLREDEQKKAETAAKARKVKRLKKKMLKKYSLISSKYKARWESIIAEHTNLENSPFPFKKSTGKSKKRLQRGKCGSSKKVQKRKNKRKRGQMKPEEGVRDLQMELRAYKTIPAGFGNELRTSKQITPQTEIQAKLQGYGSNRSSTTALSKPFDNKTSLRNSILAITSAKTKSIKYQKNRSILLKGQYISTKLDSRSGREDSSIQKQKISGYLQDIERSAEQSRTDYSKTDRLPEVAESGGSFIKRATRKPNVVAEVERGSRRDAGGKSGNSSLERLPRAGPSLRAMRRAGEGRRGRNEAGEGRRGRNEASEVTWSKIEQLQQELGGEEESGGQKVGSTLLARKSSQRHKRRLIKRLEGHQQSSGSQSRHQSPEKLKKAETEKTQKIHSKQQKSQKNGKEGSKRGMTSTTTTTKRSENPSEGSYVKPKIVSFRLNNYLKKPLKTGRNRLQEPQKTYIVHRKYPYIIEALERRNWKCNLNYFSYNFDLKFAPRHSNVRHYLLNPSQIFNRAQDFSCFTDKSLNNRLLQNSKFFSDIDCSEYNPRCFDCADKRDMKEFGVVFKLVQAESVLKIFADDKQKVNIYSLEMALTVVRRRLKRFNGGLHSKGVLCTNFEWNILRHFELSEQALMEKLSSMSELSSYTHVFLGSILKLLKKKIFSSKKISKNSLKKCRKLMNREMKKVYMELTRPETKRLLKNLASKFPQTVINGHRNIWIMKPACGMQGSGIRIVTSPEQIHYVLSRKDYIFSRTIEANRRFVIQKYIENPLLFNGRKMDIRQWVLVTSFNPLKLWIFKEFYVRVSTNQFCYDDLGDKYCHLTNISVNKKAQGFQSDQAFKTQKQFRELIEAKFGAGSFEKHIKEGIRKVVKAVMQSMQPVLISQRRVCHIIGFDFLVDDRLNVWFLEANETPDFSANSGLKLRLVQEASEDYVKVVVDYQEAKKKAMAEISSLRSSLGGEEMRYLKVDKPDTGGWERLDLGEQAKVDLRSFKNRVGYLNLDVVGKRIVDLDRFRGCFEAEDQEYWEGYAKGLGCDRGGRLRK